MMVVSNARHLLSGWMIGLMLEGGRMKESIVTYVACNYLVAVKDLDARLDGM